MARRAVWGAILALASAAAPAWAQSPADAMVYSWTGCHLNGNAGWAHDGNTPALNPTGTYLTPAGHLAPPNINGTGALAGDLAAVTHSYTTNASSGVLGFGAGCDVDLSQTVSLPVLSGVPIVLGFEADGDWMSLDQKVNASFSPVTSANPLFTVSSHTENVTDDLHSIATFRGRLGVAWNQVLIFATGGLAPGHHDSATSVLFSANGTSPVYALAQHSGVDGTESVGSVVGAGIEYKLDARWSIKGEYLFFDFPSRTYLSPLTSPGPAAPGYAWSTRVTGRSPEMLLFGINFKFL